MQPVGFEITGLEIRGKIRLLFPPTARRVEQLIWFQRGNVMTGTIRLSDLIPEEQVTSTSVVVTVNGTDLPPIDATSSPATFTAQPGDTIIINGSDTNSFGTTPFSAPFSTTAPSFPPATGPPTARTVQGVDWSA